MQQKEFNLVVFLLISHRFSTALLCISECISVLILTLLNGKVNQKHQKLFANQDIPE